MRLRVLARDRAGNEGVSPVVRVPAEPGTAVGLPRVTPPWTGPAGSALPHKQLGLNRKEALEPNDGRPFAKAFRYVAATFGFTAANVVKAVESIL